MRNLIALSIAALYLTGCSTLFNEPSAKWNTYRSLERVAKGEDAAMNLLVAANEAGHVNLDQLAKAKKAHDQFVISFRAMVAVASAVSGGTSSDVAPPTEDDWQHLLELVKPWNEYFPPLGGN